MEQIDECYHRYERVHQPKHQCNNTLQHQSADPRYSTVALESLDTVRTLHQTVVYLRKALEKAHREIDTLKNQANVKDTIEEGKKYREQEFVETNKNQDDSLLNIDLSKNDDDHDANNGHINSQTQSKRITNTDLKIKEASTLDEHLGLSTASCRKIDNTNSLQSTEHHFQHSAKTQSCYKQKQKQRAETTIISSEHKVPQMASKIDVKIKLTSNFQIDGNDTSSETTADSISGNLL